MSALKMVYCLCACLIGCWFGDQGASTKIVSLAGPAGGRTGSSFQVRFGEDRMPRPA